MLEALWERHLARPLPAACRGCKVAGVDLERVDADVSDCVRAYLAAHALTPQQRDLLVRRIADLEQVVPALDGEGREHFRLLEALAGILLHHCQADAPAA
jgi:hypothetical protein